MPPHEGDDHDDDGDDEIASLGLPVRRRLVRPGAVATGCAIAAAFAVAAQFRTLFAGIAGADRVLLAEDAPQRILASVARAFGGSPAAPALTPGSFRPFADLTLAIDWWVSRSEPGAPTAWWFHAVNLLLHAANAALVYLLLVNVTKRKLGAPLIAAALFAIHPLAVGTTAAILGRAELLGALCGVLAAIFFVRSAANRRLVPWAVAVWGLGLFASASLATVPVIVAAALVAYHEVEPQRLLSARLRRRFLWFAAPAVIWVGARTLAFGGWPFPQGDGRPGGALLGAGRAVLDQTAHFLLPARICGDGATEFASRPDTAPTDLSAAFGLAILAAAVVLGLRLLRRSAIGFPLVAWSLALVPVLLSAAGGAVPSECSHYLPMAFLCLLAAEGLEGLYYRWGPLLGLTPTLVLFAALPVLSHVRAAAWKDEATRAGDVQPIDRAGERPPPTRNR